jgi:hypothetical protein
MSAQLESATRELTAAITTIADSCRSREAPADAGASDKPPELLISWLASREAHCAQRTVLASIAKLQALLREPADFLQQLAVQVCPSPQRCRPRANPVAVQNQLLACMQWLGEFQVLTCIPLRGSVPLRDVAELTGVPETQLCHVVRMMATTGFLCEPQPGHVAHSALSAPFVTKLPFLDAAMFLSHTAAPAAMKMAVATQRFGSSQRTNESAYNVAFNTSTTFAMACEQQAKLQRQWSAYLQYGMGDANASIIDILMRLDWIRLGSVLVVEVTSASFSSGVFLSAKSTTNVCLSPR